MHHAQGWKRSTEHVRPPRQTGQQINDRQWAEFHRANEEYYEQQRARQLSSNQATPVPQRQRTTDDEDARSDTSSTRGLAGQFAGMQALRYDGNYPPHPNMYGHQPMSYPQQMHPYMQAPGMQAPFMQMPPNMLAPQMQTYPAITQRDMQHAQAGPSPSRAAPTERATMSNEHPAARTNAQDANAQPNDATAPTEDNLEPVLLSNKDNDKKFDYDDVYTSVDLAMRVAEIPKHEFKVHMFAPEGRFLLLVSKAAKETFLENIEIEIFTVDGQHAVEFEVFDSDRLGNKKGVTRLSEADVEEREMERAARRDAAKARSNEEKARTVRIFYGLPIECLSSNKLTIEFRNAVKDAAGALEVERTQYIMARTKANRYLNKAILFIVFREGRVNIDISSLKRISVSGVDDPAIGRLSNMERQRLGKHAQSPAHTGSDE